MDGRHRMPKQEPECIIAVPSRTLPGRNGEEAVMRQAGESATTPAMGGREWAMLLVLAVLWGGSFFFVGVAVRELPSITLVWLRVAVAAMALLLALHLLGQPTPTERRV
jgi:EamA-like transporter family